MNSGDSFHFIESLNLIIISHHDTLEQKNIEKVLTEFEVNPYLAKGVNVLIDVRKANITVKLEEIKAISSLVFAKLNGSKIEKQAILTDTPQINKVVEFVKAYQQSSKYQVFANLEGAMHWLKIPHERKMQIEVKLDYLETH
jgi:hypothetical protein